MQNSLTLRTERLNAAECLRAERLGNRKTDSLTIGMFSGVLTLLGLPGGFRLIAESVALKHLTQIIIDF